MAQYTNSTLSSNDWELYFQLSSYSKCLVILIILFCGLKIQLQKKCQINKRIQKESGAHTGYLDELVYLYAGF